MLDGGEKIPMNRCPEEILIWPLQLSLRFLLPPSPHHHQHPIVWHKSCSERLPAFKLEIESQKPRWGRVSHKEVWGKPMSQLTPWVPGDLELDTASKCFFSSVPCLVARAEALVSSPRGVMEGGVIGTSSGSQGFFFSPLTLSCRGSLRCVQRLPLVTSW